MAVSAGFAHGLCMYRSDDAILEITQKVSHFVPGAREKLDEVVAALPNEVFPFFHKVSQHAGDALSDITHLEPDVVAPSYQIPSATVTPAGVSSVVAATLPSVIVTSSGVSSVVISTPKTFGYTSTPEHLKNKKAPSTSRDSSGV